VEQLKSEKNKKGSAMDFDKLSQTHEEITELSNEFYELIPHTHYSLTSIPPINTQHILKQKMTMLDNLLDISVGRKILMAASARKKEINPLEYCFEALEVKLDHLSETDEEYKAIEQYMHNTSGGDKYKLVNLYRLQRKGEAERIQQWKSLAHHYLLWHGSNASNFLGILSEGLRIAPPSAKTTGQSFGKGIYFSDMLAKSVNYCVDSGGCMFLVLAEVALGKMQRLKSYSDISDFTDLKSDTFNSVKAMGSTAPKFSDSIILSNGVTIPMGGVVSKPKFSLRYNEYVVYDPSQVRMRYLVEIQ